MKQKVIEYIKHNYYPLDDEIRKDVSAVCGPTSWAHMHAYRFARAIDLTQKYAEDRDLIVDIGAYPGTLLRLLKEVCNDKNIAGIGLAFNKRFTAMMNDAGIKLINCNLDPCVAFTEDERKIPTKIELKDSSASIVFFMETIEHIYNIENAFKEIHRILKPGGIIYCTTNNIADIRGIIRLLFLGKSNLDDDLSEASLLSSPAQWRGHVRYYSLKELAFLFEKFGFRIIEKNYLEPYFMCGAIKDLKRNWLYKSAKYLLHNFGGVFKARLEIIATKTKA